MAEEATQMELPDVVVKVEPETEPVVETKTEKTEISDTAVKDLTDQYKALQAKEEAHRKEKEEAQARATAAQNEAAAARREAEAARAAATSSNLDTVTTALTSAQEAMDIAERDIEAAGQAGDFKLLADANKRLAKATTLAARLDEAKSDLEARKANKQERTAPTDPVEAYAQNRTEQTANWLREHREFVIDPRKNAKLTAAHHDAVAEGLSPDTPAYFDHVEKFIGLKKVESATDGDNVQRAGAKKQQQRPVAPVNGAQGTGGAVGGIEVRLSAGEARAADDGTHVWGNHDFAAGRIKDKSLIGRPIGIQEMARRKQAMEKQGLYDKTYYEQ